MLDAMLATKSEGDLAAYYDAHMPKSVAKTPYAENIEAFGYVTAENPSSIIIYVATFEDKEFVTSAIENYNKTVENSEDQITYTDYAGIFMSFVTTVIDAITYVLIAFVAISLIVSSIMIGVITLISVQERTKEIGILRALGASKANVSSMFNAETIIIGFTAGTLGVCLTALLCYPINLILVSLTEISILKAKLPLEFAIFLIFVSIILTLFAGIIPSRSAAKKDPVVALRTE